MRGRMSRFPRSGDFINLFMVLLRLFDGRR
jgi:hypothetical protein